MKNKKLLLSVLSTAVVASMASSAFAAEAGIYIGGDVKHYYNISSFFEPTNSAKIVSEANSAKLKNVVFVDTTGKAATLDNILASGSAALTDDLEAVFGDSLHDAYVPVDKNGQEGTDPVVPEPSDSPSVDGLTQVVDGGKVTISGNAVNADSVEVTVFKASEKVATKSVDVADNKFSVDFADLVAGDYTYEVVASNADEDSEVKSGSFKVEAPAELKVDSVSAINSTSIKLDLNKEVALTAVNLTVDGAVPTAVVQSAEDKTVWTLTVPTLSAGDHEVVVKGLEGQSGELKTTLTFEAPVATTIAIDNNSIQDAASQSLVLSVKDQYAQDVTLNAADVTVVAYNVTKALSLGTITNFANFDLSTNTDNGDVIRFTVFLNSKPELRVVKEVKVADSNLAQVTFSEPKVPTGATRISVGQTGVELPYTAKDTNGDTVKLAAGASKAAVEASNKVAISLTNITGIAVDGTGKLTLDLSTSTAGNATIRITNPATGETVSKTFAVAAVADVAEIAITAPTGNVRAGATAIDLPFALKDQFGATIDPDAVGTSFSGATDVYVASSVPGVATVAWATNAQGKNVLRLTPVAKGSTTITATILTGLATAEKRVVTFNVDVLDASAPSKIELKAAPQTTLANGATTKYTYVVKDQDGKVVNLSAAYKLNVDVTDGSSVLAAPSADSVVTTLTRASAGEFDLTVTGHASNTGKATIKVQLFNDTGNTGTLDTGEEVGASITTEVNVQASATTDTYAFGALTKKVYALVGDTTDSTKNTEIQNLFNAAQDNGDYDLDLTFQQKDSAGRVVKVLTGSDIVSAGVTLVADDASIATVTNGSVHGVKAGTTTIRAYINNKEVAAIPFTVVSELPTLSLEVTEVGSDNDSSDGWDAIDEQSTSVPVVFTITDADYGVDLVPYTQVATGTNVAADLLTVTNLNTSAVPTVTLTNGSASDPVTLTFNTANIVGGTAGDLTEATLKLGVKGTSVATPLTVKVKTVTP